MTDNSGTPVDLRIKRKPIDIDEDTFITKKKSRHHDNETPLDLSVKSHQSSPPSSTIPFYNPQNLFFNSSALLYDIFLANLNAYCQQQQQQQVKVELSPPKVSKQQAIPSSRNLITGKQESYACSCGERYTNVAHLVSHLKTTNHSAQLSSTHDEVAKLVRGQDIWLSRDTNPANQILKCLRCSLSFETLPDLTAHMMKTNHFTQLFPSSPSSSNPKQQLSSPAKLPNTNARSTCLLCSRQFAREVELVDHLQHFHQIRFNCTTCGMYFESENLYKEHLLKEMHHRMGKAHRHRDYFLNQGKTLPKRPHGTRLSIEQEVERLTSDLLDRIVAKDETTTGDALSLLQNFVIKQTPSTSLSSNQQTQMNLNNSCEEGNSNQEETNLSNENSSRQLKSHDSPLASLEKMLAYPTTKTEAPSGLLHHNGTKKKKFDKYRLFAEKMLRSTLS